MPAWSSLSIFMRVSLAELSRVFVFLPFGDSRSPIKEIICVMAISIEASKAMAISN
ncbi:hypothetical protein D3C85_1810640 [compost metagenome]